MPMLDCTTALRRLLIVGCMALLPVYLLSGWKEMQYWGDGFLLNIGCGAISVGIGPPFKHSGWKFCDISSERVRFPLWPLLIPGQDPALNSRVRAIWLNMWLPLVTALALATYLWLHPKRKVEPLCGKCGYNLTGNTSGACPECGSPTNHDRNRNGDATAW
jgi:hypothetical protein